MRHDLMEDLDPSDVVVKDDVEVVGRRLRTFVGEEPTSRAGARPNPHEAAIPKSDS